MRGKGYDLVVVDEACDNKEELWAEVIRPALSDKLGKCIFIGTPKGFDWVYRLSQKAKTLKNWIFFQFRTIDSPYFQTEAGRAELAEAKNDLDERTYRQEYEGSFENFSGRIIDTFDRAKHHTDYEYDPKLPVYVFQDFNRSPMASVLAQIVAGKILCFGEMQLLTSNTEEVCRVLKQKFPNAVKIIFRPDATGKRKTSNSNQSDFEIIELSGYSIEVGKSNPSKVDRWASTNRAFDRGLVLVNTAKCPNLTNELETICYKPGTCEADIKLKTQGHLHDALGYGIYVDYPILRKYRSNIRKQDYA
jgi:hypothetical protein